MNSDQAPDSPGKDANASDRREKRLIERLREAVRARHYSRRTEQAYWYWIRYFILFHGKRHTAEMGAREVTAFLSWLASERNVAAATQNQALSALVFLYRHVLGAGLPWLDGLVRAQRPVRLPVVLSEAEVRRLLAQIEGGARLMAGLLYGAGLRQIECLSLRVKDIDFNYRQITVRDGKGARDRATMLPESLVHPLQRHLGKVPLARARPQGRLRRSLAAACARAQVPARRLSVGLAVRVPVGQPVAGSGERRHTPPSRASGYVGGRGEAGGARGRDRQAGQLPRAAPFVRHASP